LPFFLVGGGIEALEVAVRYPGCPGGYQMVTMSGPLHFTYSDNHTSVY